MVCVVVAAIEKDKREAAAQLAINPEVQAALAVQRAARKAQKAAVSAPGTCCADVPFVCCQLFVLCVRLHC